MLASCCLPKHLERYGSSRRDEQHDEIWQLLGPSRLRRQTTSSEINEMHADKASYKCQHTKRTAMGPELYLFLRLEMASKSLMVAQENCLFAGNLSSELVKGFIYFQRSPTYLFSSAEYLRDSER